ncbi:MAG: hypothetical protein WBB36_03040, partial [Chitinophagales bacterium]
HVQVMFDKTRLSISKGDKIEINPYFFTSKKNKISAATYTIKYPSHLVSYISTLDQANIYTDNPTEKKCIEANYKLNQLIKVTDDPDLGLVTITRVALERAENLPAGMFCMGTLRFQAKANTSDITMDKVQFSNLESWQIVGPGGTYKPMAVGNNEVLLIYR